MLQAVTYAEARQRLAAIMDNVSDSHQPTIITRYKARPVVLMSFDDYNSIMETAHLLQSPANAARLRASLEAASTVDKQS
ncbi:type II toxin-antitoxin system Phd/YefM family antitoxin [Nitratidesulfovibrio vulgaris]|uniref:type II toxin-antitoxin system Phd/YefM family antitoxin n=1 Tax=Nitratidesulfovibrio vulgaris TaxID=881 RepID=UPI0023008EF3|nr:type II toxin-antitoxin system prevent-host-death family antitoxin [Nitratidesulfovibrio vulgaris]WCB45255.1 type II toxin-antitoxin system prevent-host-death family antitoxin [Nitratidesulfovibrio vulgaris]